MENLRYLTDHYDEKIQRIHEIGAPLNFIFMTDMHSRLNEFDYQIHHRGEECLPGVHFELATNAIDSMRYILDRCPEITFVVNGGDIGCDHEVPSLILDSYREVMEAFYRLPVPVHSCIGNHEEVCVGTTKTKYPPLSYTVMPETLHEICMKYNPTDENFYYIDLDTADGGYRLAFLNTSDREAYIVNPKTGLYPGYIAISERQASWIEKEVLKTDRKILVISHAPLDNEGLFGSGSAPSYVRTHNNLYNGPRIYDAVKQTPNVIALIAGHVHYDNVHLDNDLPTITTLAAMAQQWSPACPERKFGTYTETAFDVYSIKGNALYITRFGAGYDRIVPLMRVR